MNLDKKNLSRLSLLFYYLMLASGALFFYEVWYWLAFIFFVVGFVGVVINERYINSLPPDAVEIESWNETRERGKKSYILGFLMKGLPIAFGFFVLETIKNYLQDKPVFEDFGLILLLAAILFVFAPLLMAHELWKNNEQKFSESLNSERNRITNYEQANS